MLSKIGIIFQSRPLFPSKNTNKNSSPKFPPPPAPPPRAPTASPTTAPPPRKPPEQPVPPAVVQRQQHRHRNQRRHNNIGVRIQPERLPELPVQQLQASPRCPAAGTRQAEQPPGRTSPPRHPPAFRKQMPQQPPVAARAQQARVEVQSTSPHGIRASKPISRNSSDGWRRKSGTNRQSPKSRARRR